VTTKKVHFRNIAVELRWFLRGDANVRWLHELGVTIRDERAAPDGGHVDQIAQVVEQLKTNPDSRRICVSALPAAAAQVPGARGGARLRNRSRAGRRHPIGTGCPVPLQPVWRCATHRLDTTGLGANPESKAGTNARRVVRPQPGPLLALALALPLAFPRRAGGSLKFLCA
jgi:hypothetical protein